MQAEHFRYFIELQPHMGEDTPRRLENALRRAAAEDFVLTLQDWLDEHGLEDRVASLSITAFGQLQITCEKDVMDLIRDDDVLDIAAIRRGAFPAGDLTRSKENRRAG